MTIPTFRRSSAPVSTRERGEKRDRKREAFRGSRHERGYDADWTKLAEQYRSSAKRQCEECRRRGYLQFGDVVDHMEPLADSPDRRLDWSNLDYLCHAHHNGLKRRIEEYARKTGQVSLIPRWMKFPETRPAQFQIMKRGPLAEIFDAEDQGQAADDAD